MQSSLERAFTAIKQFTIEMIPSCRAVAYDSNLTTTDLQILHLIHLTKEPITASKLCSLSGLPSTNMTRILDRLETNGFIHRTSDQCDRRIRLIETVPGKVNQIMAGFEPRKQILEGELSQCSTAELERIYEFLRKITSIQGLLARAEPTPILEESQR
ncbi:MarR family winged helix-turn-helix transcriptional regulator [Glutamicibacter endophyticus]|uniref:MarR family winged helix-turn-helix transcriptional regulator n=1 Tax=Glutamicibacter endophyticus TaxID=1522174 RepID=UPI003AF016F6